jgi:hypothetical protein
MRHTRIVFALSLAALNGITACQNTADKQREADKAQAIADQKKAAAQQEALQKAVEAENAAQQEITKAQRQADDKQNAALATLSTEQVDRMAKVNEAIEDLNGKLDDLNAASRAETSPSKREEDKRLTLDLATRLDTLRADGRSIGEATTVSWPTVEAKVDKDLDGYRYSARTAWARIKSSPR